MFAILFILGLFLGSFLNAWMWRTRVGKSVAKGRSMCPQCKKQLSWRDNIPLLSFLFLKGKCRYCKKPISWQYPLVEFLTALLFTLSAIRYPVSEGIFQVGLAYELALVFFLVAVFTYDFLYKEIWDKWTTIPAIGFFVIALTFGWQSWQSMLLGVAIGAGFFLLQYVVSKGKWIGGGDIRLGVLMGVVLGWPLILVALMLAYIGGAMVSVILLALKKKQLASETPFGTYLAVATLVAYFYGGDIIAWYMKLL